MQIISEPCTGNEYLGEQAELILSSLYRMTGRNLVDSGLPDTDRYRALFEAPLCVVSHNTEADPVFNYANKVALDLFEMKWGDFITLPSRLSAEPHTREERENLLARVRKYGFIEDYTGVRVSSSGKRFLVENSIVWNLIDENGTYRGQAAILYKWSILQPVHCPDQVHKPMPDGMV
jgi:hypothetical protein